MPVPTFPDIREFLSRAYAYAALLRVRLSGLLVALLAIAALAIGFASYELLLPPRTFPSGHLIEIPDDASVNEMGQILADKGLIRSVFMFKVYARITMQDRSLTSGPYLFERPLGLVALTHRLANSQHGITQLRVTLTEGMTVSDMSRTLAATIPDFDTNGFLNLASTSEGYLFPDTYFFLPDVTPDEVILRMHERFNERASTIQDAVTASKRDPRDIVIMASILEREAKTPEDMRIVAGILWGRLDTKMALQVDAPFGYLHDENGYVPTAKDLASDSKYNTYVRKGLPPTPISNPGLNALLAAVTPEPTEYVYYLSGHDGTMHYARTFEGHKRNRELYLD